MNPRHLNTKEEYQQLLVSETLQKTGMDTLIILMLRHKKLFTFHKLGTKETFDECVTVCCPRYGFCVD